ncbi:MAG: Spo0B domain-containing protein [Syntrophothermus sp.]|nr:Spo0B domain-containing protein [Syntrophothermus sp.]
MRLIHNSRSTEVPLDKFQGCFCLRKKKRGGGMKAEEVIWFLDCQRHDYLNHLQVISGLLELGQPARAREYLKEALRFIETERMLLKGHEPELGLFLYRFWQKVRAFEVDVKFVRIEETFEDQLSGENLVYDLDSIVEEIGRSFSGSLVEVSVLATDCLICLLASDRGKRLELTYDRSVAGVR